MKKLFLFLFLILSLLGVHNGVYQLSNTSLNTTQSIQNFSENIETSSILDTITKAKKSEKQTSNFPFYLTVIIIVFGCVAIVMSFLFIIVYHHNKKQ